MSFGDDMLCVIFIFTRTMRCLLTKLILTLILPMYFVLKMLSAYYVCSGRSLIRVHIVSSNEAVWSGFILLAPMKQSDQGSYCLLPRKILVWSTLEYMQQT